jgi:two-component system chemotaxis response regulator CheY
VPDVVAVVSGEDALKAFRADRPDAVLSALHLPDMSGVRLAQEVAGHEPAAAPAFVLISSETDSVDSAFLSQHGNVVLLQKPFTAERLNDAMRAVYASRQGKPATAMRNRVRVLLVDDSPAARGHIRGVLQHLGISRIVEAADGTEAIAALTRESFDLIITDYNMPLLDGRGLIAFLKKNPTSASVPIIMVTTEQDPAKLEAVRQLGIAAICNKTFEPEIVRPIIDSVVRTS